MRWSSLAETLRHICRHMEEIAFTVVTKPYEDWDFYSDASSTRDQDKDKPRNAKPRHNYNLNT